MLTELRQALRALEKPAGLDDGPQVSPLGVATIDGVLGGGLARGALHEIAAAGEAHVAAAAGFAVAVSSLWGDVSAANSASPLPWGKVGAPLARSCASSTRYGAPGEGLRSQESLGAPSPQPSPQRGEGACRIRGTAGVLRNLVWVAEDMALAESGAPYGPGLDAFGLRPENLLTVAAAHTRDLLWAMEEALRCRAVAAVIGELRHGALDMVAVRRLSLAAAQSGALALLLRASPPRDASTAATRWIVSAAPSSSFVIPGRPPQPEGQRRASPESITPAAAYGFRARGLTPASRNDEEKMGGEGRSCFAVRLTRNRRGPLGAWTLQWSNDDERFLFAAHAQPVAAPAADRPHRKIA